MRWYNQMLPPGRRILVKCVPKQSRSFQNGTGLIPKEVNILKYRNPFMVVSVVLICSSSLRQGTCARRWIKKLKLWSTRKFKPVSSCTLGIEIVLVYVCNGLVSVAPISNWSFNHLLVSRSWTDTWKSKRLASSRPFTYSAVIRWYLRLSKEHLRHVVTVFIQFLRHRFRILQNMSIY